ncbi:MAG: hypothetical protein GXP62_16195 [Oligoflexia bacterium]|nr:hypothetical protein [Oligoflexia bacterium]
MPSTPAHTRPSPVLLGTLAIPLCMALTTRPAHAAELVWDGHYRAEGHIYDTLSLSRDNANAEGAASWIDHKARLRPGLLLSSHVAFYTQLDLLPFVAFGQTPSGGVDITTGDTLPLVYDQSVQPPTTTDDAATLQNLRVTRLWGEAYFDGIGTLRFGRVPVSWGSGMVFSDGNRPQDDAGDTEDRVSFTGLAGPVYIMGAFGVPYAGLVNKSDAMRSITTSVAHIAEQAGVGFYNTYRWRNDNGTKVILWTGDVWGKAELGPLRIEGEFASVLGSGDLSTGANGVSISSFGGQISAGLTANRLLLGLGMGIAGGDKDTGDSKIHTFAFDPDFDVALIMFEQPMPMLAATVPNDTNNGRDDGAVRTWNGVSNAVYLRPSVGYQLRDDLKAEASVFAAQAAKLPDDESANKGYGIELDLKLDYRPFEHFRMEWTNGYFMPGTYYSNYTDDTLGGNFNRNALGTRMQAIVEF